MKKRLFFTILFALLLCLVSGCGRNGKPNDDEMQELMTLDEDGKYSPKEGDLYIGAVFRFVGEDPMELDLICKDGKVADCGKACYTEAEFQKEDYIGLPYMDAFEKFFGQFGKEHDIRNADMIDIALTSDQDDNRDQYLEEFRALAQNIGFPPNKIGFVGETKERFNEKIAEFTEDAVKRQAEKENTVQDEPPTEEQPGPMGSAEVSSFEEMKKLYESGQRDFTLLGDITVDLNTCSPLMSHTDCQGHNVTVTGVLRYVENANTNGMASAEFENPGSVDLSGVTVDLDSFDDEKLKGSGYGITFRNGSYKNLVVPAGVPNRRDGINVAPFHGYACYDINDEGTEFSVLYCGPSASYTERLEQETKAMTAILTEGDQDSVAEDPDHPITDFWTEMEIDVGNVVLPNQDYQMFKLMPGAKLTINGTIAITGGRFDWQVTEADQVDIRNLTLVKKHPSPDMMKIRFEPSVGINEELLQAKASGGKIMFNKGSESFDITIW